MAKDLTEQVKTNALDVLRTAFEGRKGDPNSGDAIVVLRLTDDKPANKRFVTKGGKTVKEAAANESIYMAAQIEVANQRDMMAVLQAVGEDPSACLMIGRFENVATDGTPMSGWFWVASEKRMTDLGGTKVGWHQIEGGAFAISRNKLNAQPSTWLLLDRDFTDDMPPNLTFHDVDKWWAEGMCKIAPGLEGVGRIDLPSSSSRLLDADGKTVFPSPSSHHFIQLQNANDLPRLGPALLAQAMLRGVGFKRQWGMGSRAWSIYDPSTFSWERLSFDGKPATSVKGSTIAPPDIRTGAVGGRFDSATVKTPAGDKAVTLRKDHGLSISKRDSGGVKTAKGLRVDCLVDTTTLTLDTKITIQGGDVATMAALWLRLVDMPDPKIRAQTPFRPSDSWAGIARLGSTGLPVVYDVGPHCLFRLVADDRVGPPVDAFRCHFDTGLANLTAADDKLKPGLRDIAFRRLKALGLAIGRHGPDDTSLIDMVDMSDNLMAGTRAERKRVIKGWFGAAAGAAAAADTIENSGLPTLDEAIDALNDEFGLVMFGSTTVVVREERDALGRYSPQFLKPGEIETFLKNRHAIAVTETGVKLVEVFPAWMRDQERNTYKSVDFRPDVSFRTDDRPMPSGNVYNAWQGYGVQPDAAGADALKMIYDHLFEVMAAGVDVKYEYLLDWLAICIQQPWRTNLPLLVFKSVEEGVGKGILVDNLLMPIFAGHGMVIDSPEALTGRFNSHLGWCVMISINEAIWGGDKQRAGKYKAMITDQMRPVEQKYRDTVMVQNFTKGIISTNEDWFAPIGLTDRRHAVFDCSPCYKGNTAYFVKLLDAIIKQGGREAFLHAMLDRKVDADAMRQPPKWESEGAQTAMDKSADAVFSFLHDWLQTGEATCSNNYNEFDTGYHTEGPTGKNGRRAVLRLGETDVRFQTAMVFDAYVEWVKTHRGYEKPKAANVFGRDLNHYLGTAVVTTQRMLVTEGRGHACDLKALPLLREALGHATGQRLTWANVECDL